MGTIVSEDFGKLLEPGMRKIFMDQFGTDPKIDSWYDYNTREYVFVAYGRQLRISKEFVEDDQWDVINRMVRKHGIDPRNVKWDKHRHSEMDIAIKEAVNMLKGGD